MYPQLGQDNDGDDDCDDNDNDNDDDGASAGDDDVNDSNKDENDDDDGTIIHNSPPQMAHMVAFSTFAKVQEGHDDEDEEAEEEEEDEEVEEEDVFVTLPLSAECIHKRGHEKWKTKIEKINEYVHLRLFQSNSGYFDRMVWLLTTVLNTLSCIKFKTTCIKNGVMSSKLSKISVLKGFFLVGSWPKWQDACQ